MYEVLDLSISIAAVIQVRCFLYLGIMLSCGSVENVENMENVETMEISKVEILCKCSR